MAFSDYKTVGQVQQEFQITLREENYVPSEGIEPPPAFLDDLRFNLEHIDVFSSEASRAEFVIAPVLREVFKRHHERCSFWAQKPIAYDETLCGVPDHLFATRSALGKTVLERPLLLIVEAKKNDFELGWGQCLAELVAAQKLNGGHGPAVHGIVTDGEFWKFGKLSGATFVRNVAGFMVSAPSELLGAIDFALRTAAGDRGTTGLD